jgi:hypothetical protein
VSPAQLPLFPSSPAPPDRPAPPVPLAAARFLAALTLWQPWCWAIVGPPPAQAKRLDNRPWRPPRAILGQWIALHAAARVSPRYEARTAGWIHDHTGLTVPPSDLLVRGAVVALARIVGSVESSVDPWFLGPLVDGKKNHGWLLEDVHVLAHPVPCRGYQRLWHLPSAVEQDVLAGVG